MVRAMPLDPVRTYRILRWGEITNKKIKVNSIDIYMSKNYLGQPPENRYK